MGMQIILPRGRALLETARLARSGLGDGAVALDLVEAAYSAEGPIADLSPVSNWARVLLRLALLLADAQALPSIEASAWGAPVLADPCRRASGLHLR